ncbi:MAG TPA: FKBP-type peptidyl-prolyl cis-trans isomerase [Gemmatimonadaceae bacterium]
MKRILSLLAVVALAGCTLDTGPGNNPTDPSTETFAASLGVDIPTMTKTEAGDYYKDLVVGNGDVINGDAVVGFDYTGYLKNGTAFETGSFDVASQQETIDQLILGLEDGLQGMAVGGERLIVVPSAYGFGNATIQGSSGVTVPPNSTLVFDIKLTGVTDVP